MPAAVGALEILDHVKMAPRLVEDFRPVGESLEWRVSELYWRTVGIDAFVRNEVPYAVTSSGTLSAQAAKLLFANCSEQPPQGTIKVLETGAGSGLFARLFLDEFERLCTEAGADFFSRVTYYVTDNSRSAVRQWADLGIFENRPAVLAWADGLDPSSIETSAGPERLSGLRAVFSNYALDSMPATVLRNSQSGPEELYVRVHLAADPDRARPAGDLTLERVRELAEETSPQLLSLMQVLEFEAAFREPSRQYPYAEEALSFGHDWPRIVLNYGAIQFLESAAGALEPGGFVLINDYGLTQPAEAASLGATQRFGMSSAWSINFPLLAHHFSTRRMTVARPVEDEKLPLHPMMLSQQPISQTTRTFHHLFDYSAYQALNEAQEAARRHIDSGRFEQATQTYKDAIRQRPRDWTLLAEVAEFLTRQLSDYESGRNMAELALTINPWYSVWLYNVLGDALYALNRFEEAHQVYLKAEGLDHHDVRTALNLGYSFWQLGEPERALASLARGLARDTSGLFRERLLEKQSEILAGISNGFRQEQEWLARRNARLSS